MHALGLSNEHAYFISLYVNGNLIFYCPGLFLTCLVMDFFFSCNWLLTIQSYTFKMGGSINFQTD